MRMRILIILPLLLLFCSTIKTKKAESTKEREAKPQLIEDFDPQFLHEADIDFERQNVSDLHPADIDQILQGDSKIDSSAARQVSGFRVQLLATRNEEEARNVRREALLRFDDNVYLSFDDPYYKVRVGDCVSRYDADVLQETAIKKGYVEAWVVRTSVILHAER